MGDLENEGGDEEVPDTPSRSVDDNADNRFLEDCIQFQRYFMRRVKEKLDDAEAEALHGATPVRREERRIMAMAFREIRDLIRSDREDIQEELKRIETADQVDPPPAQGDFN